MSKRERRVLIEHKNGERYAVTPKVFHEQYEPRGFKATVYDGDGEVYEAPKKAAPKSEKGE